jgi:hypothetical protein
LRLYHYTNLESVTRIIASGMLLLTESNISAKREHAGPPVVWFTTHESPEGGHGLQLDPTLQKLSDFNKIDKKRIRITVELPKNRVHKYVQWAKSQGINQAMLDSLASQGGLYSWWVATKPVGMDDWVEIHDLQDDSKGEGGRLVWFRRDNKQHTQKDFRELLAQHGRPVPKSPEVKRIRTKAK